MERLTGHTCKQLHEAYSAVYNEDLRFKLNEEQEIQEFLELVDALVEEGYDLSEYTYDELYEDWKSKAASSVWNAVKGVGRTAWRGTVKTTPKGVENIPGAKETTKELIARTGKVAPIVALALGADQALTGGKGREWIGSGLGALSQAGRSIPSPGQSSTTAKPTPEPEKPKPQSLRILGGKVVGYDHFDMFDAVKGYLIDEGYAETEEAAIKIMANMSEEWRISIIEQSAIGARAAKVVDDQRQGYLGDMDAINKLQDAASKSMGRLKRGQGPVVTPGLPGV